MKECPEANEIHLDEKNTDNLIYALRSSGVLSPSYFSEIIQVVKGPHHVDSKRRVTEDVDGNKKPRKLGLGDPCGVDRFFICVVVHFEKLNMSL